MCGSQRGPTLQHSDAADMGNEWERMPPREIQKQEKQRANAFSFRENGWGVCRGVLPLPEVEVLHTVARLSAVAELRQTHGYGASPDFPFSDCKCLRGYSVSVPPCHSVCGSGGRLPVFLVYRWSCNERLPPDVSGEVTQKSCALSWFRRRLDFSVASLGKV